MCIVMKESWADTKNENTSENIMENIIFLFIIFFIILYLLNNYFLTIVEEGKYIIK